MAPSKWNPAVGDGGARVCRARRLDGPKYKSDRLALQDSARVDELLYCLGNRLHSGRLDEWQTNFAKSVLRQARRGGRRWMPSPRQLQIMQEIASRDADDALAEALIEELGDE